MIQRTTWATSIDKANSIAASNSRNLNILLGILGAGALATGAVATGKYLTRKDTKSEMGKIKLKMPGLKKDPNTAAEVELPIDMPNLSPALIEGLNRGVRLQARKNVRANSFKRDPETGKLIPYEEWKAQQQVNKSTEPQTSDNVIEFPALAKAASTSPGLANLLAKSLGAGVGGTVGAISGGAGAAHLAHNLGAGDVGTVLSSLVGMGTGGLSGVLAGSAVANKVVPPAEEGDPKAVAQTSYANTGSSPAGYTADPDDDFSDEDLDKYASTLPHNHRLQISLPGAPLRTPCLLPLDWLQLRPGQALLLPATSTTCPSSCKEQPTAPSTCRPSRLTPSTTSLSRLMEPNRLTTFPAVWKHRLSWIASTTKIPATGPTVSAFPDTTASISFGTR